MDLIDLHGGDLERAGAYGFNLWSLFVATIGAVVVLSIGHAFTGRRLSH